MPNFGLQIRNIGAAAQAWVRGLQQRLYQAPGQTIDGIKPGNWPSAGQPVTPMAQPDAEPLAIYLQMAQNLLFQARPDGIYTAADLKSLSMYPLARLCIENVKDVIGDANSRA